MRHDTLTPLVRFTPCAEFHSDGDDVELCAGCGWSADDHDALDVAA
jgi:hypothetical protein